jgi:hypothetical protein
MHPSTNPTNPDPLLANDGAGIRARLLPLIALHEGVGHIHSVERFVLEHAKDFPVIAPKRKFLPWVREPNHCFTNCIQLAFIEPQLTYVEGLAILPNPAFDMEHAWCVDAEGRVVDPTWEEPGLAYVGVPFLASYVRARYKAQARFGEMGSLLRVGDDGFALVLGTETRDWRLGPARK